MSCMAWEWCIMGCLVWFSLNVKGNNSNVLVIDGKRGIAETDDHFICATIDWWPPQKCDYGSCSWGESSILNLDLKNKILFNAIKAFAPLKIRLGGTLQDKVIYQTQDDLQPCTPFAYDSSQLFNFTDGCLPLSRWDQLNSFLERSKAIYFFGISALNGKTLQPNDTATGAWNSTNAESLIRYTVKKGYDVYGWEFGNELGGMAIGTEVAAKQYAADTKALHNLIQHIYKGANRKQPTIAPGSNYEREWFKTYIAETSGSLDVITHHIYNVGSGADEDLVEKILNASRLDGGRDLFKEVSKLVKNSKAVAWVSEAGGVYNSGRDKVSNAFVMGFWYVDQLGMASIYNTKTYCRQTLVGGNYGLLNTTTFVPNPDYYSALLWHRLMGRKVLSTKFKGTKMIRAYAHCAKQSKGMSIVMMNLDGNNTVHADLKLKHQQYKHKQYYPLSLREEYHLTPRDGNLQSQTVLLNGKVLSVDSTGAIPALKPVTVTGSKPIKVAPHSILFMYIPYVAIPACQ
ncbi:hypothetical protein BUALT_Bualt12G0091700 [Buddleja alternifolia]|uniref:Heparanase-like protein 3 n=1 Tax=Buddleja alternifolia TaxID=168488 RepID=A0AAV6WXU8_9LAMI|nr:hypothetical protein BUALT_Bualt12G0091700 [Buddleja alternifolia]